MVTTGERAMRVRLARFILVQIASVVMLSAASVFAQSGVPAGGPPPVQTGGTVGPSERAIPALTIEDSATMSIEHTLPSNAATIVLFSSLRNDDLIPRDIAVEFAPFVAKSPSHARTPLEQYLAIYEPRQASAVGRFLAVSVAVSQNVLGGSDLAAPLSNLSIGVRTFLTAGRTNEQFATQIEALKQRTTELTAAISRRDAASDREKPKEDAVVQEKLDAVRRVLDTLATVDKARVGFMLETALADVFQVAQRRLSHAQQARFGAWVSPIYRFETKPVDIAGVARFIDEPISGIRIFDFGGRAAVRSGGVQYTIEGLGRKRYPEVEVPGEDYFNARLVGGLTYPLTDASLLSLTLGKNYASDFLHGGTLDVSFGVTIGLGRIGDLR
jgi:hypothetical protein